MSKVPLGRPGFREWVDEEPNPAWPLMPLTHTTKAIGAEDIIRDGKLRAVDGPVFHGPRAYLFMLGRLIAFREMEPSK
jgi:hypothetical protein